MKPTSPNDFARPGRAWLLKTALLAGVLGLGTWLLLFVLVPDRLPEDFPKLPDLQSQNAELRRLLGSADAQARSHSSSAEDIGRLGMVYHTNQFYEQAESAYRIASRLASGDYRWPYCQALIQEENGKEKELLELLQKTVRLKRDYIPALQKLADTNFKQDNLDEAARYYNLSIDAAGRNSSLQAVFGLGRIAARRQDWSRVVEYVAPLSREYPHIRPAHQLLIDAYEALGQADKAAEERKALLQPNLIVVPPVKDPLYEELLDFCCSSTRLLKQAGYLSRFGYPNEVLRLARRAVEVEPRDADARHFVSQKLLELQGGDPKAVDEALSHLNEGMRLRPDDQKPLLTVAAFFFKQNKTDAAVEQLRSMLARNANNAEAHFYLGVAADHQGKTQEAISHYQDALKSDPNYAEACNRLGLIFVREGKLDQATGYFQKAVRLKPAFIRAICNLGVVMEQQGKIGQAIAQYSEVLRLNPDDFTAHMNLGLVLGRSGKVEEATRHFRETVRIEPGNAQAHYALGIALAGQRKVEEAKEEFRQALKLRPNYAEALNQLQELERKKP